MSQNQAFIIYSVHSWNSSLPTTAKEKVALARWWSTAPMLTNLHRRVNRLWRARSIHTAWRLRGVGDVLFTLSLSAVYVGTVWQCCGSQSRGELGKFFVSADIVIAGEVRKSFPKIAAWFVWGLWHKRAGFLYSFWRSSQCCWLSQEPPDLLWCLNN